MSPIYISDFSVHSFGAVFMLTSNNTTHRAIGDVSDDIISLLIAIVNVMKGWSEV